VHLPALGGEPWLSQAGSASSNASQIASVSPLLLERLEHPQGSASAGRRVDRPDGLGDLVASEAGANGLLLRYAGERRKLEPAGSPTASVGIDGSQTPW
jgi:hypothetical protein